MQARLIPRTPVTLRTFPDKDSLVLDWCFIKRLKTELPSEACGPETRLDSSAWFEVRIWSIDGKSSQSFLPGKGWGKLSLKIPDDWPITNL